MPPILNTAPYYDDFDPAKKFYRIPFRAGTAVQARELTQLQTIQDNQREKFADHIFSNGAMVIPGHIAYDLEYAYVKLKSTFNGLPVDLSSIDPDDANNEGEEIFIEGATSGVKAKVLKVVAPENTDPYTLYVKYLSSGTDGEDKSFREGDIDAIIPVEAENIKKFGTSIELAQIEDSDEDPIGFGSVALIEQGTYYIKGFFALVDKQSIILDKYTALPTYRVGLQIVESIVTPSDDDSLNDNAQGSSNFAAPGAHRYKLELILVKRSSDTSSATANEDFVELLRLENGKRISQVRNTDYSLLEDTLARRTSDESGDYYLRSFGIDIREHLNDLTNRGVYTLALGGDETKLAIGIEPSKAYVSGYELETLATTYVDVNKARETTTVNNGSIRANLGNWVYVSNVYNIPSIESYQEINLYSVVNASPGADPGSGNLIGTANARGFEPIIGTPGDTDSLYRLYIFNIQMVSGNSFEDVKSYYAAGTPALTGDVCKENILIGPARGALAVGDEIRSKDGARREKIVYWEEALGSLITKGATTYPKIELNETIDYYVSGSLDTSDSARIVNKIYSHDSGNNALIYKIPHNGIKTVKGTGNVIDTTYTVKRVFDTAVSGAGELIINLGSSEEFGSYNSTDYSLSITSGAGIGDIINLSAYTIIIGAGYIQISGLSAYNGQAVKLIAPVVKQIAAQKSKVLKTETDSLSYSSGQAVVMQRIDIFAINSITDGTAADVTDRFYLDNGQRDTHYQQGRLYLKSGAVEPTSPLSVEYQYFEHGAGGDYFSVDSYNVNQIAYKDIPVYRSNDTGDVYFLADCLDFRPRTEDTSDTFPTLAQSEIIQPNESIRADYQFYLNRIDKIYLDKKGVFRVIEGVASENPQPPEDPKEGMVLYILSIPAYTFATTDIKTKHIDNRRYTMRDIGKLEKRIENLEYYATLSMAEKETADLEIPDAATGLNRYKNGFIVDSFVGHGIGDVFDPDYLAAIDANKGEMRPFFTQEHIDLEFQAVDPDNGNSAVSSDYALTGDFLTLPYTSIDFIKQPFASKTVNVNPYNVFNWVGRIELTPGTDTWRDTDRRPDINIEDNTLFEAMKHKLEQDGVFGTVWSEWQTTWTGETSSSREVENVPAQARIVNVTGGNRAGVWNGVPTIQTVVREGNTGRQTVETTTSVRHGQTRTAITTTIVPGSVRQSVNDKIIQVGLVPYMRTRDVYFVGKRFKPNTLLFPFFDNVDVTKYVSGAGGSGYDVVLPTLTFSGGGGSGAAATAVIEDGRLAYFTITAGGSGYTSAPTLAIGAVSGATAPASTDISVVVEDGAVVHAYIKLKTDDNGEVRGIYRIPNTDLVRFRTGLRVFRLCDDTLNRTNIISTWGDASYQASGLVESRQGTITSTRTPEIVRTHSSESRILTSTVSTSETFTTEVPTIFTGNEDDTRIIPIDPLAQTFLTSEPGGLFLTEIDIFFATKDATIPVTIQIRNTVNGYPGQKILPLSEITLNPSDVVVDPDGTLNLATTFTFPAPVYIRDGVEYAIVIMANSDNYTTWVSRMGEDEIGTTTPISKQPHLGVLFKSQNASTWTAEQYEDLKFNIRRASFDIDVTSDIYLVNQVLDSKTLDASQMTTKSGSTLVRVYDKQHAMPEVSGTSSIVTISGVTGTTLNGIPIAEINGDHEISNVTADSYTINVTTAATDSGLIGNAGMTVTRNIQMDLCHPIVQTVVLPNTNIDWRMKTTSGKTIGGTQTPYVKATDWQNVVINEDFTFTQPKLIASSVNENDVMQAGMGAYNNKSFVLNATLSSSRENLSPVIDTQRMGMIVIGNRCNTQEYDDLNISTDSFDATTLGGGALSVTYTATDNSLNVSTDTFSINDLGKFITIATSGSNVNLASSFSAAAKIVDVPSPRKIILDKTVITQVATSSTITIYNNYKSEEAPFFNSGISRYITRPLTLKDPANAIKIYLTAFKELESDFDLYYRVGQSTDTRLFTDLPYTLMTIDETPQNNLGSFREYTYTVDDLSPFTTFSIKLVPKTTNSARVPRFRDIRGIALST
jgi:hypothetical protein